MFITNRQISELLAIRAEETEGDRSRAYRRAARAALTWADECSALLERGESLTQLHAIGDRLAGRILAWIEDPPEVPDPPGIRQDFLTQTQASSAIESEQGWRDLRGDLQMHTVYSDGAVTVAEMASAGIELGYDFIAITDHSKGLKIAGGVDEEGFARQVEEIDELNNRFQSEGIDFRVLRSMEMNLDVNGEGDMDGDVFGLFELVIGSFHSALRSTDDQTDRYLAALNNPTVDIIGHPRGRKFNRRAGLKAEWETVLSEAADRQKALEINSYPDRQDLNVEILARAGPGNLFSIGTDAHDPNEMLFMDFALGAAATAGIDRERIINFWSPDQIVDWARSN
ncbi:MAG: PHP domain-containing protein [Actinomycetota bacterium]|nr:PHP domain-containing protein [Actinomycetota bacterium]